MEYCVASERLRIPLWFSYETDRCLNTFHKRLTREVKFVHKLQTMRSHFIGFPCTAFSETLLVLHGVRSRSYSSYQALVRSKFAGFFCFVSDPHPMPYIPKLHSDRQQTSQKPSTAATGGNKTLFPRTVTASASAWYGAWIVCWFCDQGVIGACVSHAIMRRFRATYDRWVTQSIDLWLDGMRPRHGTYRLDLRIRIAVAAEAWSL